MDTFKYIALVLSGASIGSGITYLIMHAKHKFAVNQIFENAVSGTKGVVDDVKKSLNG